MFDVPDVSLLPMWFYAFHHCTFMSIRCLCVPYRVLFILKCSISVACSVISGNVRTSKRGMNNRRFLRFFESDYTLTDIKILMNKRIIIPIIVVLLVAIVVIAKSCGGGSKVSLVWNTVPSQNKTIDSVELKVYVENSGSMDGYMCDGSNLKDAVFDYVSDLKGKCKKINLFYVNSQVIPCNETLENYIQNLNASSFAKAGGNRANTDLRYIFEMMLQRQKKNTLTVFISDCILDIPQNAVNFFGNCQVSIKNTFNQALVRNPNLGVQIIKLQSKFNGYWYCGQNKELLSDVKRPYYIWVIGDKNILAKINKEVSYEDIIGGIDNYCAFSKSEEIPFDIDKKRYTVNHTNKINIEILADLSHSLQSEKTLADINNYSVSNPTQVKVVSSERIIAKDSRFSHVLKVEVENPQTINSEMVTVCFPKMPSWISATNDDTGRNVRQNLGKTTGIYYLINGVSEAYNSATPYGEISFKIKK